MVANSGGSNPGAGRDWDSSDEEAASQKLLDDKKKKKRKDKKKNQKQKLINGIELEQDNGNGISLDRVTEPENIKEIISKDEATTGSRFVSLSVTNLIDFSSRNRGFSVEDRSHINVCNYTSYFMLAILESKHREQDSKLGPGETERRPKLGLDLAEVLLSPAKYCQN